jgi:hypothetical protein
MCQDAIIIKLGFHARKTETPQEDTDRAPGNSEVSLGSDVKANVVFTILEDHEITGFH